MVREKLNQVPYFKNVEESDSIFGLVFGKGKVANVWENSHYTFEIEFENGFTVPYTSDGIPGWSGKLDYQTVFYSEDIDLTDVDFSPSEEVLNVKKIIKLRDKGKLDARCPSGVWINIKQCPNYIIEEYLENNKLHLFRKAR